MAYNTKLLNLDQEQLDSLHQSLSTARNLIASLTPISRDDSFPWLHPTHLDAAYAAWVAQHNQSEEDPVPALDAFSAAFGEFLCAEMGLSWKIAAGKNGNELALSGIPGRLLLFPAHLVRRRYERGETLFFLPLAELYSRLIKGING